MKKIFLLLFFILLSTAAQAQSDYPPYNRQNYNYNATSTPAVVRPDPFQDWLRDLAQEAVASGISQGTVQNALAQIILDDEVVERDQNQPETTQTFKNYRTRTVSEMRISEGRVQIKKNARILKEISRRYGVPPEVIVALWGMESNFGRNIGGFSIVSSLATLAYEGRRTEFFRKELLNAFRILDQEHMQASALRGSWAGALGQCQFMPSTYLKYAVDYDGDGRRDIWTNQVDAFASIANYLAAEGWRPELSWGREVTLTRDIPENMIGLGSKRSLAEWQRLGVRDVHGKALPKKAIEASLVEPDGDDRTYLVYDNFRALMRWNRSTYFATSVGLLADKIKTDNDKVKVSKKG